MSVERRVKPSTRMMASIRKRRLTIIACAIVAVVAVVGTIVGVNIYNNSKEHGDLVTDAVATRTLLSSRTTYRGNWIEDEQGLFEVYLPGSTVEVPGTSSKAITFKRDTEYDNKLTEAYGVVVGTERFDIAITSDTSTIVGSVMPQVIADIGAVCLGRGASGAYDIEVMTMTDGRQAARVSGDVEMTLLMQDPAKPDEPVQEKATYPLLVFVTLEKGYPVAVWGTWDSYNVQIRDEVPEKIEQCANTVWQREYLGDQVEWTPVKTTLDPDGVIVYEDMPEVSDEPVETDDAGNPMTEPSPYDGAQGAEGEGEPLVPEEGEPAPIE